MNAYEEFQRIMKEIEYKKNLEKNPNSNPFNISPDFNNIFGGIFR